MKEMILRWLGLDDYIETKFQLDVTRKRLFMLEQRLAQLEVDTNYRMRLKGAENSCRLLEEQVSMLEDVRINFVPSQSSGPHPTLGEMAYGAQQIKSQEDLDRLDKSAAEARGMTLEVYRRSKEVRKNKRLERWGRQAMARGFAPVNGEEVIDPEAISKAIDEERKDQQSGDVS